jgi:hypothetical protein
MEQVESIHAPPTRTGSFAKVGAGGTAPRESGRAQQPEALAAQHFQPAGIG